MSAWNLFSIACAVALLDAWGSRRDCRHWYLRGILPLAYGGAVAWMFLGKDFALSLRVILYGSALPILLLLWLWWDGRREGRGPSAGGDEEAP